MSSSQELIKNVQEKVLQYEASQLSLSEMETRKLIDRIFAAIGWNMEAPFVRMEWRGSSGDRPADYAFMIDNTPKLLVEAERLKESISDKKWEDQLLWYSSKLGVKWCALTNGNIIRIYNSLAEEAAADKLLFEIEIKTIDTPVGLSINAFMDKLLLLSEENLRKGKTDKVWNETYAIRKVFDYLRDRKEDLADDIVKGAKLTKKAVSEVLERLIEQRDMFLVEEQADVTSEDATIVTAEKLSPKDEAQMTAIAAPQDYMALFDSKGKPMNYTGKKPSSLWFNGLTREVRSWKDLIEELCGIVYNKHRDEFEEKILKLNERGKQRRGSNEKRKRFSKDSNELNYGRQIPNTDIFVETKIDAPSIIRQCGYILEKFGYKKEMAMVKIKD